MSSSTTPPHPGANPSLSALSRNSEGAAEYAKIDGPRNYIGAMHRHVKETDPQNPFVKWWEEKIHAQQQLEADAFAAVDRTAAVCAKIGTTPHEMLTDEWKAKNVVVTDALRKELMEAGKAQMDACIPWIANMKIILKDDVVRKFFDEQEALLPKWKRELPVVKASSQAFRDL